MGFLNRLLQAKIKGRPPMSVLFFFNPKVFRWHQDWIVAINQTESSSTQRSYQHQLPSMAGTCSIPCPSAQLSSVPLQERKLREGEPTRVG